MIQEQNPPPQTGGERPPPRPGSLPLVFSRSGADVLARRGLRAPGQHGEGPSGPQTPVWVKCTSQALAGVFSRSLASPGCVCGRQGARRRQSLGALGRILGAGGRQCVARSPHCENQDCRKPSRGHPCGSARAVVTQHHRFGGGGSQLTMGNVFPTLVETGCLGPGSPQGRAPVRAMRQSVDSCLLVGPLHGAGGEGMGRGGGDFVSL